MKKLINVSFTYAMVGILAGAFYREFSKFIGFTGKTSMAVVHTHLLVLGMIVFLICALFSLKFDVFGNKKFTIFFRMYNICLPIVTGTMFARGIIQMMNINLSKAMDASISGVAGITHSMFTISFILFFLSLKEMAKSIEA